MRILRHPRNLTHGLSILAAAKVGERCHEPVGRLWPTYLPPGKEDGPATRAGGCGGDRDGAVPRLAHVREPIVHGVFRRSTAVDGPAASP